MKIKNILIALVAATGLFTSCQSDDDMTYLSEVRVSSSNVGIPLAGGSNTITIQASGDWTLIGLPEWATASAVSGSAGETDVTFSAPEVKYYRGAFMELTCGGKTQSIKVFQGIDVAETVTCAEVNAGPDNKKYRITGIVTSIVNEQYGNMNVTDATGTVYVYGTLDKDGKEKNFSTWGVEVGDEVTVSGPKTTYGTTVELVNVTLEKLNKTLIKIDTLMNDTLPKEGGLFTARLMCKGNGVSVSVPDEAKSWLTLESIKSFKNGADVTFKAVANNGGARAANIVFSTTDGKKDYTVEATLSQEGSIVERSIAEFNAAEVGPSVYRLSGIVTKIAKAEKGNFYIKDFSGETYVYGLNNFADAGIKEGDIVTLTGTRGQHDETIEVMGAKVEKVQTVTEISVADFLNQPVDDTKLYRLTGTVKNVEIDNKSGKPKVYGNFDLVDKSGSVYIYGLLTGWNGPAKQFLTLGINEGDELTLITVRTEYNGKPQGKNACYISHTPAK